MGEQAETPPSGYTLFDSQESSGISNIARVSGAGDRHAANTGIEGFKRQTGPTCTRKSRRSLFSTSLEMKDRRKPSSKQAKSLAQIRWIMDRLEQLKTLEALLIEVMLMVKRRVQGNIWD